MDWLKHVGMKLRAKGAVVIISLGAIGMAGISMSGIVREDAAAIGLSTLAAMFLFWVCMGTIGAWKSIRRKDAGEETERERARQKTKVVEALINKCDSLEEIKEVMREYKGEG